MRYKPDPQFPARIAAQALPQAADAVAAAARDLADATGAPWMPRNRARGGGRDYIVVEGAGADVCVVNLDHAGHLYEWGSVNSPAYAPMRRAVQQLGFQLKED